MKPKKKVSPSPVSTVESRTCSHTEDGVMEELALGPVNLHRKLNPSTKGKIMNWLSSQKHTPTNRELAEEASDKRCSDAIRKAPVVNLDGNDWYDLSSQYLDFEAKYLRLRGLVKHHPSLPYLVYFVND